MTFRDFRNIDRASWSITDKWTATRGLQRLGRCWDRSGVKADCTLIDRRRELLVTGQWKVWRQRLLLTGVFTRAPELPGSGLTDLYNLHYSLLNSITETIKTRLCEFVFVVSSSNPISPCFSINTIYTNILYAPQKNNLFNGHHK